MTQGSLVLPRPILFPVLVHRLFTCTIGRTKRIKQRLYSSRKTRFLICLCSVFARSLLGLCSVLARSYVLMIASYWVAPQLSTKMNFYRRYDSVIYRNAGLHWVIRFFMLPWNSLNLWNTRRKLLKHFWLHMSGLLRSLSCWYQDSWHPDFWLNKINNSC